MNQREIWILKSSAAVIESFLLDKGKMNATILMVTHDAIAASYADRVVALSDGKIVKNCCVLWNHASL